MGTIHSPLYISLADRCRAVLQGFDGWESEERSKNFTNEILKPIFLDIDALRECTLHLMNTGILQEHICQTSNQAFHLPDTIEAFSFVDHFLPEDDWNKQGHVRRYKTYALPENIYHMARTHVCNNPTILRTLSIIQDIVISHIANIAAIAPATVFRGSVVPREKDPALFTLNVIWNAAEKTFIEELSPFISFSMMQVGRASETGFAAEEIFSGGLSRAFQAKAFTVLKEEKQKDGMIEDKLVKCPFYGHIGHLWNTHIVQNPDGIYVLEDQPKAAAFPAMIMRMISQNNPHPHLKF